MSIENCPNIIIEIGPGNLYELNKLTINRSKSPDGVGASVEITLNTGTAIPKPPQLVAIIASNRSTTYFNGLYLNRAVSFKDNALTRVYNLTLNGLYSFTRTKPIFRYSAFLTLEQHIEALMERANVYNPIQNLNMLDWQVRGLKKQTLSDALMFETANTRFHFSFEEGYLSDAFDALASLVGGYWLVIGNKWRVKGLKFLKNRIALGTVYFIVNDPQDQNARKIFAYNGGDYCFDKVTYDSLSYSDSVPLCTQFTTYGVNGRPPQEDDTPAMTSDPDGRILLSSSKSREEVITRDIIEGSVRLNYEYPQTITRITMAKLYENT